MGIALAGLLPLVLSATGLSAGWTVLSTILAVAIYLAALEVYIRRKRRAARTLPPVENRVGFCSIKREPD